MSATFAYARHGSTDFNCRLGAALQGLARDVRTALGSDLVALVLGGGYGRGEGGVVHREGVEQPYNDLDLVLVVQRKGDVPSAALDRISERYQADLGIHVDFSRPVTTDDVRHWPRRLMWQDLLNGHRVLAGPTDVIMANAPKSLRAQLPRIEATRLLLNRGAGLLWARRMLKGLEPAVDDDFVRRNYYKCALALGDALLITYGVFQSRYTGRDSRLRLLATRYPVVLEFGLESLYREALRFKFSPDSVPLAEPDEAALNELARIWGTVFLHVEQMRAVRRWPTLEAYCDSDELREQELHLPMGILRNAIRNALHGSFSWRYPRERLYRELPRLLGLVEMDPNDWESASHAFLETWKRWN